MTMKFHQRSMPLDYKKKYISRKNFFSIKQTNFQHIKKNNLFSQFNFFLIRLTTKYSNNGQQ